MSLRIRTAATAVVLALLAATAAAAAPMTLAVMPAENKSGDKRFDGLLVAQGIANILAQELYDTGMFVPVEEKGEITRRVHDLGGTGAPARAEAVARAEVVRVRVSRMRGMLGFLGGAKTTVMATVRVSLRIKGQTPLTAEGRAKAVTKAAGAFFEVRGDRIAFDATSTGRMVQEAVHRAVAGITGKIGRTP